MPKEKKSLNIKLILMDIFVYSWSLLLILAFIIQLEMRIFNHIHVFSGVQLLYQLDLILQIPMYIIYWVSMLWVEITIMVIAIFTLFKLLTYVVNQHLEGITLKNRLGLFIRERKDKIYLKELGIFSLVMLVLYGSLAFYFNGFFKKNIQAIQNSYLVAVSEEFNGFISEGLLGSNEIDQLEEGYLFAPEEVNAVTNGTPLPYERLEIDAKTQDIVIDVKHYDVSVVYLDKTDYPMVLSTYSLGDQLLERKFEHINHWFREDEYVYTITEMASEDTTFFSEKDIITLILPKETALKSLRITTSGHVKIDQEIIDHHLIKSFDYPQNAKIK